MADVSDRNRSGIVAALVVIVVLVIVVLLLMTPMVQNLLKGFFEDQERYPEYAVFSLERTLEVDANGGTILNLTLDAPRPVDISENGYELQDIQDVTYTPLYTSSENRYGVPWTVWNGGALEGQETYVAVIRYEVKITTRFWNYASQDVANVSEVPVSLSNEYLHDEWKIISSASSIQSRSDSIVGDERNVYAILESIYEWVTHNIRYPTISGDSDPQSSVETLQSKVGDCDDQAILFSALARAAGVPAWLQLGALYNEIEDQWGGHGWVQAYIPLKSGGGANVTIDTVNGDFLVWKPNRFVDFTDDGNGDHLRDYYYTFYCTYEPSSYPSGVDPEYTEDYVALSYEESSNKVGRGDFAVSMISSGHEGSPIALDSIRATYTSPVPARR
ncbi:MAG: transglutaminase-like domain-containing protein [Methanomassiliicoccales archaeon]|nr:transglutaminase-like domain-containing protein [Methanomassiliicoccales archaeon]